MYESDRIRHQKIIDHANTSYTLKRGVGAGSSSSVADTNDSDQSPFRLLMDHLNGIISAMDCCSNMAMHRLYIQFDQTIRTLIRLLNDRISSLWRTDKYSQSFQNSCTLLTDMRILLTLFYKSSQLIQRSSTEKINEAAVKIKIKLKSVKLSLLQRKSELARSGSHSTFCSVLSMMNDFKNVILPRAVKRIEKYIQNYIILECNIICSMNLKKDTFLCPKKTKSDIANIDVNTTDISTSIMAILEKKIFSFLLDVIGENNFISVINIFSESFNSVLKSILSFILKNKFQFNYFGVMRLYSIINNFRIFILEIKEKLSKNLNYPKNLKFLNIILDKNPWIKTNDILTILQTGKIKQSKMLLKSTAKSKSKVKLNDKINGKNELKNGKGVINSDSEVLRTIKCDKNNLTQCDLDLLRNILPNKIECNRRKETQSHSPKIDNENLKKVNSGNILDENFNPTNNFDPNNYNDLVKKWCILDTLKIFYNIEEYDKNRCILNTEEHSISIDKEYSSWVEISSSRSKKYFITSLLSFSKCFPSHKLSSIAVNIAIDLDNF